MYVDTRSNITDESNAISSAVCGTDFDLESRANKIYLPSNESLHSTRSIHIGRHTTAAIGDVERRMNAIVLAGKSQNWTQVEYRSALEKMLFTLRQQLKAGDIALNREARPWASMP